MVVLKSGLCVVISSGFCVVVSGVVLVLMVVSDFGVLVIFVFKGVFSSIICFCMCICFLDVIEVKLL